MQVLKIDRRLRHSFIHSFAVERSSIHTMSVAAALFHCHSLAGHVFAQSTHCLRPYSSHTLPARLLAFVSRNLKKIAVKSRNGQCLLMLDHFHGRVHVVYNRPKVNNKSTTSGSNGVWACICFGSVSCYYQAE